MSKKDQYTGDRNIAQQISGKAVKIASLFFLSWIGKMLYVGEYN